MLDRDHVMRAALILQAGLRCISIQAGRPHAGPTVVCWAVGNAKGAL